MNSIERIGIARSRHVAITGVWYFAGSAIVLIGTWDLLIPGRLDILYPGLAGLMLLLSLGERSRSLLLNSCIALTCFIGYYTIEYFENVGGWPVLLITLSILLLGMSKLALTLDRRYIREPSQHVAPEVSRARRLCSSVTGSTTICARSKRKSIRRLDPCHSGWYSSEHGQVGWRNQPPSSSQPKRRNNPPFESNQDLSGTTPISPTQGP